MSRTRLPIVLHLTPDAIYRRYRACRTGVEAGEVLAAVQVAMTAGLPYTVLRDLVLAHPTVAEGLGDLFAAVPARG